MSRGVASQIAQGQESVFRYGHRLKTWADNTSCFHPRLWCFLVGPVFLTIVLLSVTVNLFWKHSFDHGLSRQHEADESILANFNSSSTAILTRMAHQLQESTAGSAVGSVSRYTSQPELVVRINNDTFKPLLSLTSSDSINLIFKRLWLEATELFPTVDYIYYGNKFGTFVGYERLPPDFVEKFDFTDAKVVFGGEFRAPDGAVPTGLEQICEMCPPASVLRPGEKTYYFVNDKGMFVQSYEEHEYDPRVRPWYQKAAAQKGDLVWLDIYSHSSGHTLGMTAAAAIMEGSEVVAVVAADFTVSYLSDFLKDVTDVIKDEAGFIVDWDTGLMVASSAGIRHVVHEGDMNGKRAEVRYHWTQVSDSMVQSSLRTLLHLYGTLKNVPVNGTATSDDGKFLFTFTQGEPSSFQAKEHWLVVVTCPVKSFLHESWRQQAWAAARSSEVHDELMADLTRQEARTIWTCAAFALLGVVVMACIALAVTQPLKRISLDMLSMAKLEFLPDRHLPPGSSQNLHIRNRRNSTSFISIAGFGRLMSNLTGSTRSRVCSDSDTSGSSSSSSDSEVSENEKELELDLSERGCCWEHAIPREVVRMRESFLYMVTGLKSFARYMDPEIMRILVKSRRQAQLGMGKAQVTVFFSDIANFTTMAESLEPETFMSMLSEYLDEMSKIIMAKRGVVGEFIGDAIMAWWNVPIDLGQEHTAMALDAALSQQNRLRDLRDMWQARGLPDVRVRMGLVRGTVLAGNIGSSQRMKYGLVGDSVNLASRLEGLCKYYGVSIIVEQDAAFAPAVQNRFHLRLLDLVTVKGRTQATELYELVAEKGDFPEEIYSEEDLQYFLVGFAEIHRLFRSKNFGACAEALRLYKQQFPHDTPSKMLLRRVETLLAEGMPADWNPVHRLTEK